MTKDDKPMLSKKGEELFDYQIEIGDIIVPLKDSVYTKLQNYTDNDGIEKSFPKHTLLVSTQDFGEIFLSVNNEIKKVLDRLEKNNEKIIGQTFKCYERINMVGNKVLSIGKFDESKISEDKK